VCAKKKAREKKGGESGGGKPWGSKKIKKGKKKEMGGKRGAVYSTSTIAWRGELGQGK